MSVTFREAADRPSGPIRLAALAEWLQSLNPAGHMPVLVGGGAVEFYTGGAYTTGDLDFVGTLTPAAEAALRTAGFQRRGRHWIHEKEQVFLELPGSELGAGETTVQLKVGEHQVLVVGLEELVVDRLAAWQFWGSSVDAANAFLLCRRAKSLDEARLERLAREAGAEGAWTSLGELLRATEGREPRTEEIEDWAGQYPEAPP